MRRTFAGLVMPLYMPAFLVNLGVGMLGPVLPLYLRDIGLTYTGVSTVIAALGIGALAAQVPFGRWMDRWGRNRVMVGSAVLVGATTTLLGVTTVAVTLVAFRFLSGVGSTGWLLSRHAFLTTAVSVDMRGRVAALFGGVNRVAYFLGPVLGGVIAGRLDFGAAFLVIGAVSAAGALPLVGRPEAAGAQETTPPRPSGSLGTLIRTHRRALGAGGLVQLCAIGARQGRLTVIPLMGEAMGLHIEEVGALVAVGAFSDLCLFPVSGCLMDRFGRPAALVPFLTLFGGGLLLAAASSSTTALTIAVAATGFANGLGSGTMLTMGSDLAPPGDASRFLSLLGLARDIGRVVGPLAVGWMADAVGLSASAVVLAMMAFLAAAIVVFVLGDTRDAHSAG